MNTIPAAWYDDPAGSGGHRWWDGTAWSDHVRPAEQRVAPVEQTYPQVQPYETASAVPATQYFEPTTPATAPEPYRAFGGYVPTATPGRKPAEYVPLMPTQPINGTGVVSMIAGIIGLAFVVLTSMSGTFVMVVWAPLIIAMGSGVRALSEQRRNFTGFTAPLVGIACAVLALLIFFLI